MQLFVGVELLRGFGEVEMKSTLLSPVSNQPSSRLNAAVVFERSGAAAEPSKQFAPPYPTKSMIDGPDGHCPVNATVSLTRAILPAVDPTAIAPIASGVGRSVVPPAPAAC